MEELSFEVVSTTLGEAIRFHNNRGGVVPLMAVVAVPLMASVGIAVDYSRINAARTAFQVTLDATALMRSKTAATETDAQRQTEATNTFNSLFSRPEVTNITISPNSHQAADRN